MVVTSMEQTVHRPGKAVERARRSFMGSELALVYRFEADLRPGGVTGGRVPREREGRSAGCWHCYNNDDYTDYSPLLVVGVDIISGISDAKSGYL